MNILALQHSNTDPNRYVLYGDNQVLYLHNTSTGNRKPLVKLEAVSKPPIALYFHHPYVCVSERFGLNSDVVHIETGVVRHFTREDYHSDVSSFSIGFLEQEGKALLIHQTQWNRLDITDLETGELLTDREVSIKEVEPGHKDEDGQWIPRKCEEKNYLDYFHSLLHVSPGYKNFLSNGWVWSPWDNIRCFSVDSFLRDYEPGSFGIDYGHGYNWDRPCSFIDDNTFVVAVDDLTGELDEEERETYLYRQLHFYRLSGKQADDRWLPSFKQVGCSIFSTDNMDGELFGDLWYDTGLNQLIALSDNGAFGLDLDGTILWKDNAITYTKKHVFTNKESTLPPQSGWQYSTEHHRFYRYDTEHDRIIDRNIY